MVNILQAFYKEPASFLWYKNLIASIGIKIGCTITQNNVLIIASVVYIKCCRGY
jgi:hypothetical protein